jgi:hypothetical protein
MIDARPPRRPFAAALVGGAAAAAGLAALPCLWSPSGLPIAAGAIALHGTAALLSRWAARLRGALPCECDLVWLLALAAPVCGPALAWLLPPGRRTGSVRNAHAASTAGRAGATAARRPRLERELQVVSHVEVLQQGTLEEKRNLLRQLARVGQPRHLRLLRQFLHDPEPELRLCAYAELARLAEAHEARIGELRIQTDSLTAATRTELAAARAGLAEANRALGTSGVLDAAMARYWLEQARQLAENALRLDGDCRAAQRVLALVLAELGDSERAWQLVADWPDDVGSGDDVARAELAFRRRDRRTCVAVARRLRTRGDALPPWLDAVMGDRPVARAAARPSAGVSAGVPIGVEVGP